MASRHEKEKKKVHYTPSTAKGGKPSSHAQHGHHHKTSRDSGVGSSSASDRASLGTSSDASPFNSQEIQNQRHNTTALNEALDSANERIRELERKYHELNNLYTDCKKENRQLMKERGDFLGAIDDLKEDLEEEKKLNNELMRTNDKRTSAPPTSISNTSSIRRPEISRGYRRESMSSTRPPPVAPQAPQNDNQNPFIPLSERPQGPQPPYAPPHTPSTASYTPTTLSYASSPQPIFTVPSHAPPKSTFTVPSHPHPRPPNKRSSTQGSKIHQVPNDGNYHAYPV